ncbi:MAG: nicotinate (nicotinamide) nucleotide adenylyltransferase [Actinobacteria bacterium RBG_16_68_21]|nr:MAG: nicotinate (nicotinamide) nucleotide adenylyltransferase [Actinobacteria bacterium RBG_16_68_21]
MRRGLLGGTFDPPHLAHLIAGEAAYRALALDEVTFIPAGAPWQKADREVSDAEDRWEMARRAVAGVEYFRADDREVRRDGWSYTIDTIAEFAQDEIVLIMGADAAAGLPAWHRAEEVMTRASVAVMPRPGVDRGAVEATGASVHWLDVVPLAVSGTLLRARCRAGLSIRFYVPEPVHRYVIDRGLYGHQA